MCCGAAIAPQFTKLKSTDPGIPATMASVAVPVAGILPEAVPQLTSEPICQWTAANRSS